MKKVFDFGKIDYCGKGCKENRVTVTMEYREQDDKKVLSISGSIWNKIKSDVLVGGQCLDIIAEYIHTPKFQAIHRLWKLYHLNDMHPECIHQNQLGWIEIANEEVLIYNFVQTIETIRAKNKVERHILNEAKTGKVKEITEEERRLLCLDYSIKTPEEKLPDSIAKFYKLDKTETKALGWLTEDQHPEGVLGKPCPVCGYKYGHGWNYFDISKEDEKIIYDLLCSSEI